MPGVAESGVAVEAGVASGPGSDTALMGVGGKGEATVLPLLACSLSAAEV